MKKEASKYVARKEWSLYIKKAASGISFCVSFFNICPEGIFYLVSVLCQSGTKKKTT